MFVQNTSAKPIGFVGGFIMPGKTGELPKGYGENHPTIQFYLKKGWLTKIDALPADTPAEQEAPAKAPELTEEEKAEREAMKLAMIKEAELQKQIKERGKMNKEKLCAKADELGIDFAETDTNAVLIEKITAGLRAE
jgi:hypothetical protein